jgi:hypothetical protein
MEYSEANAGCRMATRYKILCIEALLRDPELKTVLKAAIEKGAEIVSEKSGS